MKNTKTHRTMKLIENKNFKIDALLIEDKDENYILTLYVYNKGLKIVCSIQTFKQPNDPHEYHAKRLNEFIEFLTKIEKEFDFEELVKIDEVGEMFDDIERGYFEKYLKS
jgi:hypothetical protein